MGEHSTHIFTKNETFFLRMYCSFCFFLSICMCFSLVNPVNIDQCIFEKMKNFRLKNPKQITLGHLNINSIPNKFDGFMDLVKGKLDILLISETKIDHSFPDAQFCCEGFTKPHRKDRNLGAGMGGGGLLMYINENIPSRLLKEHIIPANIEIMCVEINLRKQKWVVIGIYRPPSMNVTYFLEHLSRVIDCYYKKYERVIIMGDFNIEP